MNTFTVIQHLCVHMPPMPLHAWQHCGFLNCALLVMFSMPTYIPSLGTDPRSAVYLCFPYNSYTFPCLPLMAETCKHSIHTIHIRTYHITGREGKLI